MVCFSVFISFNFTLNLRSKFFFNRLFSAFKAVFVVFYSVFLCSYLMYFFDAFF